MSTESQKLAELRNQMDRIVEGPLDAIKGAYATGKNLVKNFKGGLGGDAARTAKGTYAPGASAAGMANKGGKAVAANPVKTAAATGVAGAAATGAAMSGGGAATKPADANTPATASKLSPEEQQELDALSKEFDSMMGQSPELDALLLQATNFLKGNAEVNAVKKNAGVATPGAATKPAAAPATTTSTNTNTAVSGNMKMGQPDGPITYNGKTVNPGDPEYSAASAALMKSQEKLNAVRPRTTTSTWQN